jgi:general secretion pathway protein K
MRGVALVAVLWVVMLLSVMATAVATQSVEGRRVAARNTEAAHLDVAAESAIRQAIMVLLANLRTPDQPRPVPDTIMVGEVGVQVQISREAARLDLNTADDESLIAYLLESGLGQDAARDLTNRIRDWQDADDIPREGSLERDGYEAMGSKHRPRNGPLESVEEVLQVAGATDAGDRLVRGTTIYSHLAQPQKDEGVARITAGDVVRLRACAASRCCEVVARITGSLLEPIQVFVWRGVLQAS